jgi:hypothetical protein
MVDVMNDLTTRLAIVDVPLVWVLPSGESSEIRLLALVPMSLYRDLWEKILEHNS